LVKYAHLSTSITQAEFIMGVLEPPFRLSLL
jgi:hypothetical protein